MAHITNYQIVLQQILDNNIRCFAVYNDPGKKSLLYEDKSGDLTPELAKSRLENFLAGSSGLVYVELAKTSRAERAAGAGKGEGIQNPLIPIQLGGIDATAQRTGMQGITGMVPGTYTADQVDKLLAEKEARHQAELRHLQQTAALQKQMDELNRKLDEDKTGKYLEQFAPAINGIISNYFTKAPVAVAGVGNGPAPGTPPATTAQQVQQLIETSLDRILAIDPQFPMLLAKIADLAETNPDTYNMAKTMLQNQ